MKKIIPIMAALLAPLALLAQEKKGPYESDFELPGSRAEVYKTIGDVKLKIYIYEPKGHKAGAKRPAIVFFLVDVGGVAHQGSSWSTAGIWSRRGWWL